MLGLRAHKNHQFDMRGAPLWLELFHDIPDSHLMKDCFESDIHPSGFAPWIVEDAVDDLQLILAFN